MTTLPAGDSTIVGPARPVPRPDRIPLDPGGTRVPIDTEATAAPTTRRTFLTRAAVSGALVGVGVAAGPLSLLAPSAGAQDAPEGDLEGTSLLDNATFAAFATPLELAAVQAYQAALDSEQLDTRWQRLALQFQTQHQTAVTALTEELADDAGEATANDIVLSATKTAIDDAADQEEVLLALSDLERTTSATHLYALGGLQDTALVRLVAQVLAVESQQCAVLGRAGGLDLEALTPAAASTDGARTNLSEGAVTTATTAPAPTTAPAGEGSDSEGSAGGGSTETTPAGN